jgi:pimeloyl-ACP methyl ester carboxylesterase
MAADGAAVLDAAGAHVFGMSMGATIAQEFAPPEGYMAQLQAIYAWQSYDRLPQISAPRLVIHGESDRLVPPAKLIASWIPGAKLVLLPNAGHLFTTDQPEAAHAAVMSFLEHRGQQN